MNSRSGNFWKFTNNYFYPRDHYYHTLVDKYDDPNFFRNLYDKEGLKVFKTSAELIFRSKIAFGADVKEIIAEMGKPKFIYEKEDFYSYKILFYRTNIGGEKVKIELHLLRDKLFMYNYIFSYLTHSEKKDLLGILSLKYLDDKSMNIADYKVRDKNKSILIVEDSVDLTIWYLSGNRQFYRLISDVQTNMEVEKEKKIKRKKQEFFHCL